MQRILNCDRCPHSERRECEADAADRRAALREHDVQTDGAKQGAFARHVRPADDDERVCGIEQHIVGHGGGMRQKWVRESLCIKCCSIGAQRGEAAGWPLIREARERTERLEVANAGEPRAHMAAMATAPCFDGKHAQRSPEDESVRQLYKPVVAGLKPLEIAFELCNGT